MASPKTEMLPLDLEAHAALVGLAYLKLAYRTSSLDQHYLAAVKKMHRHLMHSLGYIPRRNPYMSLVRPGNRQLAHNLPHMQVLLNISIDRSRHSPTKVSAALRALR